MGRDCKREKRGNNWGEINIKPDEWGEINIKPKEWDETVRERREGKTRAR